MSRYLQDLIQEARFLREQGQLQIGDQRRVEQLQDRIQELEAQFQQHLQSASQTANPDQLPSEVVPTDAVKQVLTEQYRPLEQVLDDLLQCTVFRTRVKQHLEADLYSLGEHGEASFRRGHGWKQLGGDR